MAFSDARNERDRAETGKNSGNHGGESKAKAAEARNRAAMSKSKSVGGNKLAGNATVADHMIATGRISAPSIPAGGVAQGNYATQDDAYNDYAKAVGSHATRGFFDKALDYLLGGFYDPQEPMAGNPRSFAGGDWHSTSNPGSIFGGLMGMAGGPAGTILGKVMGPAYSGLGLPEIWHGGLDQPDYRNGLLGNTDAPMGGSMADIGSGHTYPSGGAPGGAWAGVNTPLTGGGTGNGGQSASLGNGPMSPQAPRPQAAPTGMAAQGPMSVPGSWLSVPGGSPYGVMSPSYKWGV